MNQRPELPNSSPVNHLRKAAKKLLTEVRTGDAQAIARIARFRRDTTYVCLSHVYWVIAQELGYRSWDALIAADAADLFFAIGRWKAKQQIAEESSNS